LPQGEANCPSAVSYRVDPGSPAERAGLHSGDLVVAVNGVAVRGGTQLRNMIGLARVGGDVELTVDRRGAERKVAVHIDPAGPTAARQRQRQRQDVGLQGAIALHLFKETDRDLGGR